VTSFPPGLDLPTPLIEGDPSAVSGLAEHYRRTAERIRASAARLKSVKRGNTASDAVDAFLEKAGDLASKLQKTDGRYQGTGDALATYATALQSAIDRADTAGRQYATALGDWHDADRKGDTYSRLADSSTSPDDQDHYTQLATSTAQNADAAAADVRRLQGLIDEARSDRDRAAERAISAIDDSTDDGLKDNWFDKFSHWMKENDGWISVVMKVVQVIGTVLAVAALIFPLTSWLGALALGFMIASTVVDVAKASAGTGSWADVGLDALGFATFGAGKLAVTAGRAATESVAFSRVGGLAREGASVRSAVARVNRSYSRIATEGIRRPYRAAALGDPELAQMLQWYSRSRVGAALQDADAAAKLSRTLRVGQGVMGTGLGLDLFGEAKDVIPSWNQLSGATTARLSWGTSW
jgi:hypothetical protein